LFTSITYFESLKNSFFGNILQYSFNKPETSLILCSRFFCHMATTKNKKKTANKQVSNAAPESPEKKRQIRLAAGIFFLIAGIFICFSILSYFFTWQADQDKLITTGGLGQFLSAEKAPVANWGGRLGATLSHLLVYQGAGIAAIVIGFWIGSIGLNLVYGKRVVPLMRYLRWLSILLLVGAPVLAYILPNSGFPWGGAWGNEAISYLNGLMGKAGTGMILAGVIGFFVFVVFALDIRPLLRRARRTAAAAAASLTPTPVITKEPLGDPEEDEEYRLEIEEDTPEDSFQFTLSEKESKKNPTEPPARAFEEEYDDTDVETEEIPVEEPVRPVKKPIKEDFSFEVIQQEEERSVIKHGAHISIQDNEAYAPELDLPSYKFPTLDLLENRSESITLDKEELEKNKNQIISTLRSFGIEIQRISATVGPTVTLYEIVPAEGVRISKIRNLEDDIALNLAALGIRIIAPIPGKGTIGIEVPNANKQIVSMRGLLSSEKFANSKMSLPIALGKKIDNENYIVDLATMPHLLMAGATGQGKSVGINAILVSLLYKKHPSQVKFVMVDPKKVELSIYRTIEKHFLAKLPNEEEAIITDTTKVIYTLNALCIEMDNRYELLKEAGARNIKEYNEKFINRKLNPKNGHKYLPFIVLVIDEFADLIMTAGKEVEMPIARLAQLARAVGIHLIIATQRPSVNVITGTIKANFPGRIAFKVSAKVDSRTILDAGGAEQLIGRGDMLVSHGSELLRLQCAFIDTPEVEQIVDFIGKQRGYPSAFELPEYEGDEEANSKVVDLSNRDKLFEDCAKVVVQTQSGSTSMLQRRFNLGYNRAGRIMDQLEAAGIVGPAIGSKPRDVIFHTEHELEQFLNSLD
jgi:S-DNA-T family DNA segregation ATPase FtsK/SpoIIIE